MVLFMLASIGWGLLFLVGGWALERTRRQLVRTAKEGE
jgi:hypothetical protein